MTNALDPDRALISVLGPRFKDWTDGQIIYRRVEDPSQKRVASAKGADDAIGADQLAGL